MRRSVWISLGLTVALALWMLSGQLPGRDRLPAEIEAVAVSDDGGPPMRVSTEVSVASAVEKLVIVQGQVEPARRVTVRAQTSGLVEQVRVRRGARVDQAMPLVIIEAAERPARVRQARADLQARKADLDAAKSLQRRSLQSATQVRAAEAAYAAARTQVQASELDLARATVRSPFAGVVNARHLEVGDFVDRGDPVAEVIDDGWMRVSAHVPQHAVHDLAPGAPARVGFIGGAKTEGEIRFVAAAGEPSTRTFRIEVRIENPDGAYRAGTSAELTIPVETVSAHFLSLATLSLNDRGELGVKVVDGNDTVVFAPVTIVRTTTAGAWVTGLGDRARVITLGHGFVQPGEVVEAVPAAGIDPARAGPAGVQPAPTAGKPAAGS